MKIAPPDLFRGARLKMKRANQHIEELEAAINAFLKVDFYSLGVEKDLNTGLYRLQFKITTPTPEKIPLVIGDALHNLRVSLDFVANEIVRRAGGSGHYIKFPVRETKQEVEAAVNGGELKLASKFTISAIVNQVRPYKGGNDALWSLHDLDITDKHLLLIPVIQVAALSNVSLNYGSIVMTDCFFYVERGAVLNVVGGPAPPESFELKDHGQPVFSVAFDRGQPFEGEPVIPTLHQLSQLVSGIVDTIEMAYIAGE